MVIDLNGNWRLYQTLPPQHGQIIGTVTNDFESGALLKTQVGRYAQLNANVIKSLDQSAVRAALLRALMAKHNLTRGDIARMLGLTPRQGGSHGTVDMWLSGGRNIPASKLELIEIKAAQLRDDLKKIGLKKSTTFLLRVKFDDPILSGSVDVLVKREFISDIFGLIEKFSMEKFRELYERVDGIPGDDGRMLEGEALFDWLETSAHGEIVIDEIVRETVKLLLGYFNGKQRQQLLSLAENYRCADTWETEDALIAELQEIADVCGGALATLEGGSNPPEPSVPPTSTPAPSD